MLQVQLNSSRQVYAGCQLVSSAIGHTRVQKSVPRMHWQAPTAVAAHADSRHVAEQLFPQQYFLQDPHEQQQQQQQHESTMADTCAAQGGCRSSVAATTLEHANGTYNSRNTTTTTSSSNSNGDDHAALVCVSTLYGSSSEDPIIDKVTNGNGRRPHVRLFKATVVANTATEQVAGSSTAAAPCAEARDHLQPVQEQQQQQHRHQAECPPLQNIEQQQSSLQQRQQRHQQQKQQYDDKQQEQGKQVTSQQSQQQRQQQQQQPRQGDHQEQQQSKQQQLRPLPAQQWQQRRQRRQQKKLLKQHQQQRTQQRLQQLQRCDDWRQLLLLAADTAALLADPQWLCGVVIRAVQLCQPSAAAADRNQVLDASGAADVVDLQDGVFAVAAVATAAALDQARHVQLQQKRFVNNMLALLGRSLQTAAAAAAESKHHTAAAAPIVPQLCQVLTQLADSRVVLPIRVQQQLKAYISISSSSSGATAWQAAEVAAVVVALARLRPTVFLGQNCAASLQQQLLDQALGSGLPADCNRPDIQGPASAKQAAALSWAAAQLRWRPSQQWVLAAAAVVVQQVDTCSAGELAAVLWAMAHLKCDMLLLRQTLQQQQQGAESCSSSSSVQQQPKGRYWQQQLPVLQRPMALAPDRLLQTVFDCLKVFNAQDLVKVLFATAQIPLLPQRQLVVELLQQCQQQSILATYTDVDLECILWSLARIQQQQDLEGQQQQQQQLGSPRLHLYRQRQKRRQQQQRDLSNVHCQAAQTTSLIILERIQPLLDAVLVQLPASDVANVCSMLYSVALLDLKPPSPWLARVLSHVAVHMCSLGPAGLAFVIFAVAEFRFLPSPAWLAEFYAASLPLLLNSSRIAASTAAAAAAAAAVDHCSRSGRMASVDACDPDNASSSANGSSSSSSSMYFNSSQLAMVAAAVHKISRFRNTNFQGQKPRTAWLDALAAASFLDLNRCNSYNHQYTTSDSGHTGCNISAMATTGALSLWGSVMKRFSRLAGEPWSGPGTAWYDCYITASELSMTAASPWDLCNILQAVVSMQKCYGMPPESWIQTAIAASRAVLAAPQQQFSKQVGTAVAADLVLIGKSFAQLRVLPDQQWQQLWISAVEIRGAQMTSGLQATFAWTKRTFAYLEQQQRQQQQGGRYAGASYTAAKHAGSSTDSTASTFINSPEFATGGYGDDMNF